MQVSTVTLLPNDVIFKAFGPSRHHIGNIRFNALMESYYSIYNEFQFVDARAYKAKVIDRIIDNEINPGRFVRQNKDNNTYTLLERDHFRKVIRTRLSPSLKKKVSNTQRRVCLHKVTKSYWLSSESSTFQSTTTSTSTVTITSNVESTNTSTNQSPTAPSILLPPLQPPLQPSVSLHEPTPPPLITPVPLSPTPPTPTPPLNEERTSPTSGTQLNQAPIPAVSMSSSNVDNAAYDQDTDDEDAIQLDSKPSPVPSSCTSGNIEGRLKKEEDAYDMDTDNEDMDDEEEGLGHKYKTEKHPVKTEAIKEEKDTDDE